MRRIVEIEVIDLTENFAEKFRALVIRKNIAIRDIYDIYFILKSKILKINESMDKRFTREDLIKFIGGLKSKLSDLNEKDLSSLLKSDEKVSVKEMIQEIVVDFQGFGVE